MPDPGAGADHPRLSPFVIDGFAGLSDDETVARIAREAEAIRAAVTAHGAIILPRLLSNAAAFDRLVAALLPRRHDFVTLSSPRKRSSAQAFTSTEMSAKRPILLHQELVYLRNWPEFCTFCGLVPAAAGGGTTLGSARRISRLLPPEILEEFHRRGVRYVQTFRDGYAPTWQDAFQTNDIRKAIVLAESRGMQVALVPGGLRVEYVAQGAVVEPDGSLLFANQAHLYHVASLGRDAAQTLVDSFGRENLPRDAQFGDGGTIPDAVITAVNATLEAEEIVHDWQRGDVIVLDNLHILHGRRPFTGERHVVAAFGGAGRA